MCYSKPAAASQPDEPEGMILGVGTALTVWLLNPYHTGSHCAWAEGYVAASRHRVRLLAMDGAFWKWRMLGGAMELAQQAEALLAGGERPDVLLATSMTNLPAFLALTRHTLGNVPVVLYMHENQLTYPLPPGARRDLSYPLIQHLAMLAADRVCFNSAYHLRSWFDEVPRLLKHFPDYTHLETVEAIRAKSQVLPVGCDLRRLDRYRADTAARSPRLRQVPGSGQDPMARSAEGLPPLILWNQRWEYDKDPPTMLRALYALADEGIAFRVALAGENARMQPTEFLEARERLGTRVVHYGYLADDAAYARLLWSADVVLSTAIHEFFGVGVVEAIYCGARPVLPDRLSYPELLPAEVHAACLYRDFDGLLAQLRAALVEPRGMPALRDHVARFDWAIQAPIYDDLLEEVARQSALTASGASPGSSRITVSSACAPRAPWLKVNSTSCPARGNG
ncbi:MAG: tRNA-queuosine alpha-mannosyltransferase domain-containing protein [Anaerolineae bacterium]